MLVKCPKCKTTYKVSEEVLKGAAPVFRCSRCKHTFELGVAERSAERTEMTPPVKAPSAASAEDDEPSFAFAPKEAAQASDEYKQPEDESIKDIPLKDKSISAVRGDDPDHWSMSGSEPKSEEPFTFTATHDLPKLDKSFDPPGVPETRAPLSESTSTLSSPEGNILSLDPYRDQQASIMPYLTLFGLLLIFFSVVTVFNQANPGVTAGVVRKIPLFGASVLRNNRLKDKVLLQSLYADYRSIQGNREVFVITGVALNRNPIIIREVRVKGQVYNQDGKELEQQTVWIGNAISPKIVRGMTAQDISDLQRLKPLKSFEIPPGDSIPFTIVFLRPAKGVRNFSCEVISAEGEAA
jgi:predicted Zn finger-like uncharacterized protein